MAVSKLLEYNILPGNRIIKLARDRGYTTIYGILNRVAKVINILPKCKDLYVQHVDVRKKSQYNEAHIINAIQRDLKVCNFSDYILHDFISEKAKDFFFAFDSDGTCVAGASVDLFSHVHGGTMLYVNYLCSSKKCSGAGSILMKSMETFAKDNGMLFVGLTSTPRSRTFYPKIGYVRVAGAIGPASNSAGATRSTFKRHSQFIKRLG
jgi:GNAT superfamily N-acetyltransferase